MQWTTENSEPETDAASSKEFNGLDANTVIIVHLKLIRYSSEVALRSHFPS